jgi:GT2 family glycosyltransferase
MTEIRNPSVAVVILNYNTKDLLELLLPKVLKSSYAHMELWVADNASRDGSVDRVREKFPDVHCLAMDVNRGYAGGYNEALKKIKADYYVLLNSDVEVEADWLEPMVELAESDDRIACIQPKILDYYRRTHFEYAGASGGYIDRYYYPYCRGRLFDTLEEDKGQYNESIEVFWATGACLFISSQAFDKAAGLDSDFFAHMEEIDLCWRLKRMGYKHFVCPQSVVYHMGGGTLSSGSKRKYMLNYRNNLIMVIKNLPERKWWRAMLWRMSLDGISAIQFLVKGKFQTVHAILLAHYQIWSRLKYWRSKYQRELDKTRVEPGSVSIVWAYFIKGKKHYSEL